MCLITIAPKGVETLDWKTLSYSASQNDDGFGLAWYDGSMWIARKSIRQKTFQKVINKVPNGAPLIIHQRFATHGPVNIENTHPFNLGDEALLFHNGVISGTRADSRALIEKKPGGASVYAKATLSDTRAYVEDELHPLVVAAGVGWLAHEKGVSAVEARVGYSNVIAIAVNGNPKPIIINEWAGDWVGDLFYSNSYSRPSYGLGYSTGINAGTEWEDQTSYKGGYKHGARYGYASYDELTYEEWAKKVDEDAMDGVDWSDDVNYMSDQEYEAKKVRYDAAVLDESQDEWVNVDKMNDDEWEQWMVEHGYSPTPRRLTYRKRS